MTPGPPTLTTRLLTKDTLVDFERLFETRPAPDAFDCWCLYHHGSGPSPQEGPLPSSEAQGPTNREQRRTLVEQGLAHGILVYAGDVPVGWCQFGPVGELPRFDENPKYRTATAGRGPPPVWRITCFTVDARYRGQGVARTALQAALDVMRAKGGGLVEAYPADRWDAPAQYLGTRSMFEKAGFELVAPFGESNLVMRKTL